MIGFSLVVIALCLGWLCVMLFVTMLVPHDVGRWLAYVRNGYNLWVDKK